MAKNPEPPIGWNIYKIAANAAPLGEVGPPDKAAAIDKFQGVGHEADGDMAMRRGTGEITRNDLKRKWPRLRRTPQFPHHVALPAEKGAGRVNRDVIFCAAGVLSATPFTYSMRHDDSDVVAFCFSEPEGAGVFAGRFAGERR